MCSNFLIKIVLIIEVALTNGILPKTKKTKLHIFRNVSDTFKNNLD